MSMLKPLRSSIACEFCRKSKIKCQNKGDGTICVRCLKLGRDDCSYKPKGHQQMRRNDSQEECIGSFNRHSSTGTGGSKSYYYNNHYLTSIKFPPQFLLLKVIDIFFSNQYNGIFQFVHKDNYISYYKSVDVIDKKYLLRINHRQKNQQMEYDPVLLLAILSICARFEPSMVEIYGVFNEDDSPERFEPNFNLFQNSSIDAITPVQKTPFNASNYFGYFARQLLKDVFDRPTIQRIQALSILSSHEWGNCNASRSYLYNGIAARMAIILGLNNPQSLSYIRIHEDQTLTTSEKNIKLETYRRTMWSVYMMDRANASGRNRSFAVKIEEIRIPLPSLDSEFLKGLEVNYANYDKSLELLTSVSFNDEDNLISPIGFQIFFFELWSKISKWCGEIGSVKENISPLNKSSNFNKLINDLNLLESKLPNNFKFSIENLTYHIKSNSVEQFGYLHCLIFLSKIFLYREIFYLRNLISDDVGYQLISLHDWWRCTKLLLKIVRDCSNLIKTLKSINLIVDAPFLAFQIFTNSIICQYFVSFANGFDFSNRKSISLENLTQLKEELKKLGELNIDLLQKNIWTLGEKYYSIIKELNTNNVKNYLVVDRLKNKIHDYGQSEIVEDEIEESNSRSSPNTESLTSNSDHVLNTGFITESETGTSGKGNLPTNLTDTNINELIQNFGFENWENFDMGNVLPGWNSVDLYSINT